MPNDKAAPPFATRDGEPIDPETSATGNDFQRNPAGNSPKAGGRDFSRESRPQPAATGGPGDRTPWVQSRPQQAGSPEQRVNMTDAAKGGTVLRADPGAATRAIGAADPSRRPFRLKGG